jgi:hypothetical protein
MRTFHCNRCEHLVFYENVLCERCEALLGFVPQLGELSAFEEAGDGLWRRLPAPYTGNAATTRSNTSATG